MPVHSGGDLDDLVWVRQVELRVHALAIEVHRQGGQIHVAGALAIAEQCAFDTVGSRQQCELGGGHRTAAGRCACARRAPQRRAG